MEDYQYGKTKDQYQISSLLYLGRPIDESQIFGGGGRGGAGTGSTVLAPKAAIITWQKAKTANEAKERGDEK